MSDIATAEPSAPKVEQSELLDINQVCAFFGGTKPLNPATIYRGAGKRYPKPIKIGPNINRWLRSECVEALHRIIAESRAA
jgi:predicted DNA-binding transcriptional regulator AlpA